MRDREKRAGLWTDLSMGGAGHVDPIDLNDLVPGLQPTVPRHQAVREDFLHHDAPKNKI